VLLLEGSRYGSPSVPVLTYRGFWERTRELRSKLTHWLSRHRTLRKPHCRHPGTTFALLHRLPDAPNVAFCMVVGHGQAPSGARLRGFSTVRHTRVSGAMRSGCLAIKPLRSARLRPAKCASAMARWSRIWGEAGLDDSSTHAMVIAMADLRCCELTTGGHGRSALLKLLAVRAASNARFGAAAVSSFHQESTMVGKRSRRAQSGRSHKGDRVGVLRSMEMGINQTSFEEFCHRPRREFLFSI
jgi:hypothetical protein